MRVPLAGDCDLDVPRERLSVRGLLEGAYGPVEEAVLTLLRPLVVSHERLRRLADREGVLLEYDGRETFTLAPPASPAEPDGMIAERVGPHSLPGPYVCALDDCTLVGTYSVALTDRGRIVLEAVVREELLVMSVIWNLLDVLANPTGLWDLDSDDGVGTGCLLYNYWSGGYFHWTYESLSRLEGVERYAERTGETPTLILGPDPPSWQRETLALLGYGPEDWIRYDGRRLSVDRLVVPSVRRGAVLSPAAVRWLRGRVRDRLADEDTPDPDAFPDRVYVSRADADRRQVANEDAVVAALADRGFSPFVLSELSVPEQAALFAGADAVVAPHGAGLTNLTYADDPVVVELFRAGDVRGQYYQLATILGLEYHYRIAERDGWDLRVDVDELHDVLDRAGVTPDGRRQEPPA